MQIDEEFQRLIPPLLAGEREQLEINIIANGCLEPLTVWRGTDPPILIDGHNRLEICEANGLEYQTRELAFADRDEVILWIIENQMGRRNVAPLDKVPLIERRRAILEEQRNNGGRPDSNDSHKPGSNLTQVSGRDESARVEAQLAKDAGVSRNTYEALKSVSEKGSDGLKQAVRENQVGASTAAEIAELPEDEQDRIAALPTRAEKRKAVHVAQNSKNDEWYTPGEIIEAARAVMGGIDLDPASCEVANTVVQAGRYFTEDDNGLEKTWTGNVWLNPPYSTASIKAFTEKALLEWEAGNPDSMIVLVNNGTETGWFQEMAIIAESVCFPRGRIKFLDSTGEPAQSPLQGQVFLYFGSDTETFAKHFSNLGLTASFPHKC